MNNCVSWLVVLLLPSFSLGQGRIPLASGGGVTLYSVIQPEEHPLSWIRTAKIVARAEDPLAKIATFEGIDVSGDVVQAWHPLGAALAGGNPFPPTPGALWAPEWTPVDTHLLVTEAMISGGDYAFSESNDASLGNFSLDFGGELPCACSIWASVQHRWIVMTVSVCTQNLPPMKLNSLMSLQLWDRILGVSRQADR